MNFISNDFTQNVLSFFKNPFQKYTETVFINNNHQVLGSKEPKFITVQNNEFLYYSTTAQLFLVINKRAELFANGIFKHLDKNGKEIDDSPYVKLLNNPHPLHTLGEFLRSEMVNNCVYGASFIYPIRGYENQEIPSAITVLPSMYMKIYPTGKTVDQLDVKGVISKFTIYENKTSATTKEFKPTELIYRKTANPSDMVMPASPIESLTMEISNIRSAKGFLNVVYNDHGMLGILSGGSKDVDGGTVRLSSSDRERIEKQLGKDYGWKFGKRKIAVSETPVNWQATTFPIKDYNIFETIDNDFRTIINTYGLNETLFKSNTTYANLKEAKRMAIQDCIIPYAIDFCYNLSQNLGLLEKDQKIILDYSHLECMQINQTEKATENKIKAETYKTLIESGMNEKEALRLSGLDVK